MTVTIIGPGNDLGYTAARSAFANLDTPSTAPDGMPTWAAEEAIVMGGLNEALLPLPQLTDPTTGVSRPTIVSYPAASDVAFIIDPFTGPDSIWWLSTPYHPSVFAYELVDLGSSDRIGLQLRQGLLDEALALALVEFDCANLAALRVFNDAAIAADAIEHPPPPGGFGRSPVDTFMRNHYRALAEGWAAQVSWLFHAYIYGRDSGGAKRIHMAPLHRLYFVPETLGF